MAFEITTADVWAGEVEDRPGALAEKLEALYRAGANLEFAIVRPSADIMSSASILFVAPVVGEEQVRVAEGLGMDRSGSVHALRIIGPDQPGLISGVTRTLSDAGIAISGLWAAAFGDHSLIYLRLESSPEAKRAAQLLATKLS